MSYGSRLVKATAEAFRKEEDFLCFVFEQYPITFKKITSPSIVPRTISNLDLNLNGTIFSMGFSAGGLCEKVGERSLNPVC